MVVCELGKSILYSVADPDPGSGIRYLFDPWIRDLGSGIGFFRIPDPTVISESLKPIFSWVKNEKNAKCATVMSQDLFQQEWKATKR
jgi:hypothetical protein